MGMGELGSKIFSSILRKSRLLLKAKVHTLMIALMGKTSLLVRQIFPHQTIQVLNLTGKP
jgi:hypothetical protein